MIRQYDTLGETLFFRKLPNGLTVAVVNRRGFQRKLAYFVTDFGSIHTDFELDGVEHHTPVGRRNLLPWAPMSTLSPATI